MNFLVVGDLPISRPGKSWPRRYLAQGGSQDEDKYCINIAINYLMKVVFPVLY